MRRHIRLREPGCPRHVGHALLSIGELLDDAQPVAVGEAAEKCGAKLGRLRVHTHTLRVHTHTSEYPAAYALCMRKAMNLNYAVVAFALVAALSPSVSSALASVATEEQAGKQLAQQVQAGKRSCDSLSKDDLDHIGEFVMGRMIGSISAHEAMNARMTAVLGSQAESRMHKVLGARFVGCAKGNATSGGGSAGSMNGQGMMGSGSSSGSGSQSWSPGDWGTMMGSGSWGSMMRSGQWSRMMGSSGDWSWMTGSRWKHMTSTDWQTTQRRMLGTATVRATSGGWHARDVALLVLAVILAAGLVGVLLAWHPWRRSS